MNHLTELSLTNNGSIHPLIIPTDHTNGTGLMNPSIYNDGGKILVNLRHVNYTFYHSEAKLFQHPFGPLTYIHPEHDLRLITNNFYCELDEDLNMTRYNKVDTSANDIPPVWEFVGQEDARIFRWGKKLYMCGVRRDVKENGEGRMELTEITVHSNSVTEVSRFRIPAPIDAGSYCEKNWMPVLDKPYHFIKWTNPTELVKVDPVGKTCEQVSIGTPVAMPRDIRGGSQVLRLDKNHYFALTHEVDLFKSSTGRKDAVYRHRFIVWDNDFNLVKYSNDFSIMDAHVEFSTGMCRHGNDILISFGFQDNAAYVLRTPCHIIERFIDER